MRNFVLYDFILVYELKLMLQILHTSDSVSQLTDPKAILTGSEEPGAPFSRYAPPLFLIPPSSTPQRCARLRQPLGDLARGHSCSQFVGHKTEFRLSLRSSPGRNQCREKSFYTIFV